MSPIIYDKEKLEKLRHRWTTPRGRKLLRKIKKEKLYLSPALFKQNIHNFYGINDEEVRESIDLRGANLSGRDFRIAFKEDDSDNFIEEMAVISNIHFEGAILRHCSFAEGKIYDCHFEHAELAHAGFQNSSLINCNFFDADLSAVDFQKAVMTNCNFSEAIIKDIATAGTFLDAQTTFGEILKSEKLNNYHFASIEYKKIKEIYRNSNLYSLSDKFHYKEMVAKRKQLSKKAPMYWLNLIFGDLLFRYGTSYLNIFITSLLLMFFCAFVYYESGHLMEYNTPLAHHSFGTALYFSIITFTTVGYGDIHIIGPLRFLAATESFLGLTLVSLFTVVVARNLIRD